MSKHPPNDSSDESSPKAASETSAQAPEATYKLDEGRILELMGKDSARTTIGGHGHTRTQQLTHGSEGDEASTRGARDLDWVLAAAAGVRGEDDETCETDEHAATRQMTEGQLQDSLARGLRDDDTDTTSPLKGDDELRTHPLEKGQLLEMIHEDSTRTTIGGEADTARAGEEEVDPEPGDLEKLVASGLARTPEREATEQKPARQEHVVAPERGADTDATPGKSAPSGADTANPWRLALYLVWAGVGVIVLVGVVSMMR